MSAAASHFRAATEAGDVEGMLAALTPDAFLRSPVAGGLRFEGHDQLRQLFTATTDAYQDIDYTHDFGNDDVWVLSFRATIGRQEFQETLLLELDQEGTIESLTASIRPLPGVAAVAAAVGRRLARRHGRARAVALAALTAPLLQMTRTGDAIGPRLVKPAATPTPTRSDTQ